MNEEFDREGTPIHIIVPTQEQIDNPTGVKFQKHSHHKNLWLLMVVILGPHSNN